MLIELTIENMVGTSPEGGQVILLLKEKHGDRLLPIMMSHRRASTLMTRHTLPIPMPVPVSVADIYHQLIKRSQVKVARIELTILKEGSFLCNVVGEHNGEEYVINFCQAQDGLVIAVTEHCPITIDEQLLQAQYMRQTGENVYALNIKTLSRQMLEDALNDAVQSENYEAASYLRDELAKRPPMEQKES